jgi:hypothetical protein
MERAPQECKTLALRRFSPIINAVEITWRGFIKSAVQTMLSRQAGKVLIRIKQLWLLAEKGKRAESFRFVAGRSRDNKSLATFRSDASP